MPQLSARPGKLTRDYLDGHRAAQIPPFRLFLVVLVMVFFAGSLSFEANPVNLDLAPQGTFIARDAEDRADCLVSSAEHVLGAVSGIRDLKKPSGILEHCVEINRLENAADSMLRGALAKLFRENKDPISVIKWKEIYETLEAATDRCEDVANVIEGVVLENS